MQTDGLWPTSEWNVTMHSSVSRVALFSMWTTQPWFFAIIFSQWSLKKKEAKEAEIEVVDDTILYKIEYNILAQNLYVG